MNHQSDDDSSHDTCCSSSGYLAQYQVSLVISQNLMSSRLLSSQLLSSQLLNVNCFDLMPGCQSICSNKLMRQWKKVINNRTNLYLVACFLPAPHVFSALLGCSYQLSIGLGTFMCILRNYNCFWKYCCQISSISLLGSCNFDSWWEIQSNFFVF